MADGQIAVNPQTGERLMLRGGQWVPVGGSAPLRVNIPNPRAAAIPMAPQAQQALNLDTAETGSRIESRAVGDVNTAANTDRTRVATAQAQLDLEDTLRKRARGSIVNDEFTNTVRNQLLALKQARGLVNNFSTGTVGELIGDKPNAAGEGGSGLADLPVVGPALYGDTDRSALKQNLAIINAGAKFNMIDVLKQRGAAEGNASTGLGQTAVPEFTALGQTNFNLEDLSGGRNQVNRQLNQAEETLLRRYAALSIPSEALVNATPEERKRLLEESYRAAEQEYGRDFEAPAATPPQNPPPGGGSPLRVDINAPRAPQDDLVVSVADRLSRNTLGAGILSAADGFLLGAGDELAGAGDAQRTAQLDAIKNRMREESPIASTVGSILGGVASFIPIGRAVSTGAQALGAGARATGLALGATNVGLGATAGALDANEDRKAGAIIGAGAALAGDAAGRFIGGRLAGRLAPTPSAADRAIAGSVTDPTAARGVLAEAERLGSPAALADTSPSLRALAGQTVARSEEAGRMARNNIGGRDVDAVNRAVATVNDKLARQTNVEALGKSMRAEGSAAVDDLYKAAFSRAAPVADPDLKAVMQRDAVREGLQYAKKIASNRGKDWAKMGVDLDAQGNVVLKKGASFESLDMVKRGIDDYLDTFRNDVTGQLDNTNTSRAVIDAREALVTRMRELNPEYGQALDTYAPFAASANALERGGKAITNTSVTPAQLTEVSAGMAPDELSAFQIGAANQIINTLKKVKDNADPFQIFRSPDTRERLAAIFPDKAGELADIRSVADMEGYMRSTREALLGGSATQGRQVAGQAFEAQANVQPGILAGVAEGRGVVPSILQRFRLGQSAERKLQEVQNQEALSRDLAPILMETDPREARKALNGILARVEDYDKASRRSRRVGRSAGAATATGLLAEQ